MAHEPNIFFSLFLYDNPKITFTLKKKFVRVKRDSDYKKYMEQTTNGP